MRLGHQAAQRIPIVILVQSHHRYAPLHSALKDRVVLSLARACEIGRDLSAGIGQMSPGDQAVPAVIPRPHQDQNPSVTPAPSPGLERYTLKDGARDSCPRARHHLRIRMPSIIGRLLQRPHFIY
jgi:hypothetical protein